MVHSHSPKRVELVSLAVLRNVAKYAGLQGLVLLPKFSLQLSSHSLQPDQEPGREGFIRSVAEEPDIFSNLRATIDDQVCEGDKVVTRFTWRRVHDRGEFLGLAPTGMEIETTAIVINRESGGKVVEEWSKSTGVLEATRQPLEQERLERERLEHPGVGPWRAMTSSRSKAK